MTSPALTAPLTRPALLTRALDRLKAGGFYIARTDLMEAAQAVVALWPSATAEQRSAMRCGLIDMTDEGVPVLPGECANVFGEGVFVYSERSGEEHEGINIGALIGITVDRGDGLELTFGGLKSVRTAEGLKLVGPLACAVARFIEESGAAGA